MNKVIMKMFIVLVSLIVFPLSSFAAQLLERAEIEAGTLSGSYAGKITSPFSGVALYGNNDASSIATAKFSNAPGIFQLQLRGASSNASAAGVSVYLDNRKVGSASFTGTAATTASLEFQVSTASSNSTIKLILETDTGANDTFLDWYELSYVGPIPPPPAAPTLPTKGAYETGVFRNLFLEAGYAKIDIDAKVNAAYNQLFHSANKDRMSGEAIFIEDPTNSSRAYIWDTGNNDVRSEGLSYGMMIAVQMNKQTDFNKIWAWANHYALNTSGDMKGYFGWQKNTDGTNRDVNPAPDGEEYMVMALFFASHRWGDGTGIYNYKAEANKLLDNMFNNGQTHYVNGVLVPYSLFDKTANQILFSPYGTQHTDPSYHLPAFYELWSRWATNNKTYWKQLAVNSRAFWKTNIHPTTGLNSNYANFDGSIVASAPKDHQVFYYDAWRTAGNAATDYAWWTADSWQVDYIKKLHSFFKSKGANYPSLYELDGRVYNNNSDHSAGLVAMNSMAALASNSGDAWDFVKDLWNTGVPTGQYRYYDGTLYMLGLLASSGNYKIYCPNNACAGSSSSSSSAQSSSVVSSSSSSSRASSVSSSVIASSSRSSVSSSSLRSSSSSSSLRSSSSLSSSRISSVSSSSRSSVSSSVVASSSSVSSTVGGGLLCEHVIANQWDQGFTANIRLTNKTTKPISNWNISWRYQDGSLMTNGWNAIFSGTNPYSATPLSWMTTINPGQTVEIGVQGNKGSFAAPAPTAKVTGNFCNP